VPLPGASAAVSTAVTDAYQGLRDLVLDRLRGCGIGADRGNELIAAAADQSAGHAALTVELARVGVDEPTVDAAQQIERPSSFHSRLQFRSRRALLSVPGWVLPTLSTDLIMDSAMPPG
jgi:hypothetical protein